MFAYNPQTTDRSGEIMAAGQIQAAQTNAQMMGQLGQDIGGALASVGQMYGAVEERKAKGRSFKKTLEVMGPALGMTTDKLKAAFGDVKSDFDYANLSDTLMPIIPAWINSTLASGRMGIQQNQPFVNAGLDNARDLAGGRGTFIPGGGGGSPAPIEPPLPGEEPLPAVTAPGLVANPITDTSRQRAQQWWQKRSQGGP
jgi:hypothetical protein